MRARNRSLFVLGPRSATGLTAAGFNGRVFVAREETENNFGKTISSEDYYFAVDLGDGETILAIHVEAAYDVSKGKLVDENIIKNLLSYIRVK